MHIWNRVLNKGVDQIYFLKMHLYISYAKKTFLFYFFAFKAVVRVVRAVVSFVSNQKQRGVETPRCWKHQGDSLGPLISGSCNSPVSKTQGGSRFQICITVQKFDRIQNFPGKLLLGQGEIVWWKNLCLEISRDCPFNPNLKALLFKILIKVPFLNWWIPVQGRAKSELILVNTTYDLPTSHLHLIEYQKPREKKLWHNYWQWGKQNAGTGLIIFCTSVYIWDKLI